MVLYSCYACRLAAMAVCLCMGLTMFCMWFYLFSFTTFKDLPLLLRQVPCLFVVLRVRLCANCSVGVIAARRVKNGCKVRLVNR